MIKGIDKVALESKEATARNPLDVWYLISSQTVTTTKPRPRQNAIYVTGLIRENTEREILHCLYRAMSM